MQTEPHRLVFIDETGTNTKMTRARGRCERGERLRSKAPFGHWKTQTFVAGLRCGALTAPWVIDAPMDRTIFETYVRTQLVPKLQEGDIVILDNLPAHKSPAAEQAIRERGAWLMFLPPYSPDLNPIEMAFAKLKAHLRAMGMRTIDELWKAIGQICDLFNPQECANYFKAAGYIQRASGSEEFHARLAETLHTWVEWSASQLLQNTPLHPIAEWGRLRFGADAPAEQRLADLEGTLRLIGLDPTEHAPLLAPLVDIPLPPSRAAKFSPEEVRRRQLTAMAAWVLAGARSQPAVVAFEDLHWADPTSLDLMRALAERGAQASLLIIATTRPEFRPPWSVRSHHSVISLSPLDRVQVAKMVAELSAHHALSGDIVEGVNERTGGVPLFVEEVTRLLLERGEQGGAQAIPPTLQQSLAARLDRLGSARETAQIGAVLGRGFSYALLQSVAGLDESALRSSLERLAEADILFVEGDGAQATYRFKHALIQDAAYDSLLRSRRQSLHRRAAEILRDSATAQEPEAIAHHFTQAGLDDLAIEWWGKAGDQALRRSAFQEAISHLGKAIAMADKAAGAASRPDAGDATASRQRVKLQANYSEAVMYYKGFSAEETRAAWARAAELGANRDDFSERSTVRHGQWTLAILRGELHAARELASTFLREAENAGRPVEASVARRSLGIICYYSGDFLNARIHCERALEECRHGRDLEARERFSDDTGAVAMSILAITSWQLGEVERANELINMANHRAVELGHAPSKVHPLYWKSILEILRGDAAAALITAKALEDLCEEHAMGEWGTVAEMVVGWAHGRLANPTAGAAEMRQALAVLINKGGRLLVAFFQGLLAGLELETLGADSAVARIDEALVSADQATNFASLPFLHRLRGDILLKRKPPVITPAEDAYRTAIAVAKQQGARSYELLASLSLAKLYKSTGRLADAHAVLVPALVGFSPTPEMPEIAEAQALVAELSQTAEVEGAATQRGRLTQLHVAYGNALIAARGYGAPETTEAFARARKSTAGEKDAPGRLSADYGLWVGSFTRGELPSMRAHAADFLSDVQARPDSPEAGVAHRVAGATCWFGGEYREAKDHLERALAMFQPGRDDDLAFRFGQDQGVSAMAYLALVFWPLGEIDHGASFMSRMLARIASLTHGNTIGLGHMFAAQFALMHGGPMRGNASSLELARIASAHDLTQFRAFGMFFDGWARVESDLLGGLDGMRAGVDSLRAQNIMIFDGLVKIALANTEAEAGDPVRAVAILDDALAAADRLGHRTFEPELHRARGDILLQRDPANSAPAQEAFLTAIAVSRTQGTRSFELRAALSLAKLYQSTGRPIEAHAVLAPALEGFSPTLEMPEIAEARTLRAALSQIDEVKTEAARRQRLTQLQVAYGNALIAARGPSARETTEAFARARESTSGDKDATERLAADFGLWLGSYQRGELPSMRTHAAAFLSDVEARPDSPEAGVAHRNAGATCWFAGEYREARDHFETALALFQPGRDEDLAFRFGADPGVGAMAYLTTALWPLGEVDRAISFIDRMQRRMADLTHVGTLAYGRLHAALFELMRGDRARAAPHAFELTRLAREHDLSLFRAYGAFLEGWENATSGAIGGGLEDMRRGVELLREQNVLLFDGLLKIALAEAEDRAGDPDRAIAILDQALATCDLAGYRAFEAELHRACGEMLLKRDPSDPAPAEDAFLAAIAVAKQQGTRSFELRAALSLAKLYQSAARPADAHAVLVPALEGFAPTPEMPEIGEAQALLGTLA